MKLDISHFARIKKASIKLDGITVIAGENNTGKSTVGKILFGMFHSLYEIDEEIKKQRVGQIARSLMRRLEENIYPEMGDARERRRMSSRFMPSKVYETAEQIQNAKPDEVPGYVRAFLRPFDLENADVIDSTVRDVTERVSEILKISDDDIECAIVESHFDNIFNSQIQDAYAEDSSAEAELFIKGKSVKVSFSRGDGARLGVEVPIAHDATCIDSPFVMDYLGRRGYWDRSLSEQEEDLINKLNEDVKENELGEILVSSQLDQIFRLLDNVTKGKIVLNEERKLVLKENDGHSFDVKNLSMGIKAFSILRMLLERGIVREKDVLILDEPEIHLHPEWQLAYAEIIVLLEKYFDLTILLTTHSPYFLEAIETYTQKYGISGKTNFYLAQLEGKEAVLEDVTENLEPVYKLLAEPFATLDNLRYME